MHFSLFSNFGALNSKPIFEAFAASIKRKGWQVSTHNLNADIAVIWSVLFKGRMLPNKEVYTHFRSQNKPVIILEVGALQRNHLWKVALNSIDNSGYYGPSNNNELRRKLLNLKLKEWKQKENILVCLQNPNSLLWSNMPPIDVWVKTLINEIRKYSDRKIIIRSHPRAPIPLSLFNKMHNIEIKPPIRISNSYDSYDFEKELDNTYAVINWNSNPAIESILYGVPVVVGNTSLASPVGNFDVSTINNLSKPDRTQWLNDLAYTEWTVDEIDRGIPLDRLISKLT
jgi:hypothetical protein